MEILGLGGGKPPVIPIPQIQHASANQTFIVTNYNPKYNWTATATNGTTTLTVLSPSTLQVYVDTSNTTITITSKYKRVSTSAYVSVVAKTYTSVPGPENCTPGSCQATCGCCNCFNGALCQNNGSCQRCESNLCPNGLCFAGAASPCASDGCICCTGSSCSPGPTVQQINSVPGYILWGSSTYGAVGEWYLVSATPIAAFSTLFYEFFVQSEVKDGILDLYIKLPNEYTLEAPLINSLSIVLEFYNANSELVDIASNSPTEIVVPVYRYDHQYILFRDKDDHSWYAPGQVSYKYTIVLDDDNVISDEGVVR